MRRIYLELAIILSLVLVAGGAFVWYFVFNQKPGAEIAPGTTANATPAVGFGSLNPYANLCAEFQKTESKISCEKAVEIALGHSPGKIQKISIGPVRTTIFSESSLPERRTISMWLIDIILTKPYFDNKFNKQINVLQIGIRIDEHNLIYQKPLE